MVILAIWGASYLWSCALALSAPGVPVRFKYQSPGGVVQIAAESYTIDWKGGVIYLNHPRVLDPSGGLLASADKVLARGLLPVGTIDVDVRNAYARVTRLDTGAFDISHFLPKHEGPPSETPFAVHVDLARVRFVDLAGREPFAQTAIGRDVEVRGVGEAWMASGSVAVPSLGGLRAFVQNTPGQGLFLRATTSGLRLAPLLAHFKQTPDAPYLKDVHASTLVARGPFSAFIPAGVGFQFSAQVHATGTDVGYAEYVAKAATFEGRITEKGATGVLQATNGAVDATYTATIDWHDGVDLGGRLIASSPSIAALPDWLGDLIPDELAFRDAHWQGSLQFSDAGLRLLGEVRAEAATAYGETVQGPVVAVNYAPDQLRLALQNGSWERAPVHGALLVGLDRPTLTGAVTADSLRLAELGRRFGVRGLSGTGRASAIIGGTREKPTVLLRASGNGAYALNGQTVSGHFQGAGRLVGTTLDVDRLRIASSAGVVRALGEIEFRHERLALKVDASGVDLSRLNADLEGVVAASGLVRGTVADPRFQGRAAVVGLAASGQQIPLATAQVMVDRQGLGATAIRAIRGAAEATGELAITWKDRSLSGHLSAENVLLNDLFGDQFLGVVSVPDLTLGGALKNPKMAATIRGDNLVLGGIIVDHATLQSHLVDSTFHLDEATARIGEGVVSASGTYNYAKDRGQFQVTGDQLALNRLTPVTKTTANVTGDLSGTASATVANGVWAADAKGLLKDIELNDTAFGNGSWTLAYADQELSGSASVGKLDRFLLLEDVNYSVRTDEISAQVSVLNADLHDLYASTRPFFPQLSTDLRQVLDTLQGNVDATIAFTGAIGNPNIDANLLDVSDLALKGEPLGRLQAAFTKTASIWNAKKFDWTGPQGTIVLNEAKVDTEGPMSVDGEATNLDLALIRLIDPSYDQIKGTAAISFLARGQTDSPTIRASFHSTNREAGFSVLGTSEAFGIDLDTIEISQADYAAPGGYTGGIQASGKFFYRGITGEVAAHLPLNYPFEIPDGPPITATITIPEVPISQVAEYAAYLDAERSKGRLSGQIRLTGPASNLGLDGYLQLQAETLALIIPSSSPGGSPTPIQTTLEATVARVALEDQKIVLTLQGQSSEGGALAANVSTTIPDVQHVIEQVAKGATQQLIRTPVDGAIHATNFEIKQQTKDKALGAYRATIDANLTTSGPAVEPLIAGRIGIKDTNVLLPSVFSEGGPTVAMLFDPHFEIAIGLDEVARFRTGTADVALTGGGELTGSLATPSFSGALTLESGHLSLPTSRVALEPGGTLRPSYRVSPSGRTTASLDVDLEGHTAVTALRYGNNIQRYDIDLRITGDLLQEGGLVLNATSSPPDLSQSEILALLGQADVLKSFESGTSQSEAEQRIRNALLSIAVPQLTQGLTSQIAKGLGLEYLNLEYNALEGPSVAFAKVLGKNLVFQGRRQISLQPGQRALNYDLRLTYRLPTRNRTLGRFVFSVGLDQDRPSKLGIDYGFRF